MRSDSFHLPGHRTLNCKCCLFHSECAATPGTSNELVPRHLASGAMAGGPDGGSIRHVCRVQLPRAQIQEKGVMG
ncbi:hypothetical protein ABTD44_20135, partial [Acinetobacter baumannii]